LLRTRRGSRSLAGHKRRGADTASGDVEPPFDDPHAVPRRQIASKPNASRRTHQRLRRERHGSRSSERAGQLGEDRQVGAPLPLLVVVGVYIVRGSEGCFVNHSGNGGNFAAEARLGAMIFCVIGLLGVVVGVVLRAGAERLLQSR